MSKEIFESKFNIILDGQFGSTGKGLIGAYLSINNHAEFYVSNLSPNAGHTYILSDGKPIIVKQLPVGAILNKRSTIYLAPGSIINVNLLLQEIEKFEIDYSRLFIHPRCAIIEDNDINNERNLSSSVSKIASTQSGTGEALANKILRKSRLAKDVPELKYYIKEIDLMNYMDLGCTVLMETSQGFDLGINHGLDYPHCTSRDVTASKALADAGVHPKYLGNIMMSIRTYPIRVGHLYDDKGNIIGHSGPFYEDSDELTWNQINEKPERTTVTNKIRRIATFSEEQYKRALYYNKPEWIFLNFCNYLKTNEMINKLIEIFERVCIPTHLGFGPSINDVYRVNNIDQIYRYFKMNQGERIRERFSLTNRI